MSPERTGVRVSVVIPTRDRADAVEATVRRLAAMRETPDQVVVVDDGSDDDTAERLSGLEPAPVVVRSDGSGPATARNRGAAVATGDWLVFLDDDDEPHDDWMTTLRALMERRPSLQWVSTGFERDVSGSISPVDLLESGPAFGPTPANFVAGTFAVRRPAFDAAGGFLDGLRCMEFTDLALGLLGERLRPEQVLHDGTNRPITISVRPPEQRSSQRAEVLESSWQRVRTRHTTCFERDRRFAAAQCSTIAVAWLRCGEARRGRRWLREAIRSGRAPVDLLRLLVASVPPARRRVWGGGDRTGRR